MADIAIDLHAFLAKELKGKELSYTLALHCNQITLTIK